MLRSAWQRSWKNNVILSMRRVQATGMMLRTKLNEFSAAVKWLVLDRHQSVERKAHDAQIAHDNNDVRGCFARALHEGKPRAHKMILKKNGEKKLKTRIKEKKGRNIGQKFFRAGSKNFIVIDLFKVAHMNTARIWICHLGRWRCRLPDVVGTKLLVVICYPTS